VQSVRAIGRGYSDRLSLGASMAFEQSYFFERLIRPRASCDLYWTQLPNALRPFRAATETEQRGVVRVAQ
jgi:hypothetical protein